MSTPFTYLIGWSSAQLFYYGVRYARNCEPSDLWTKYFTSSSRVSVTRLELGEPDIIQIRRTFSTSEAARTWETRVLTRINAKANPLFLNRTNIPGPPPEKTAEHIEAIAAKLRGLKRTPEQRANMRGPREGGWKLSEETKARQSLAKKGVPKSAEHSIKLSALMAGRIQSEEEREKRKQSLTGKKKSPEHVAKVVEAKRRNKLARLSVAR
jgi:hypothetical protein